VVSEILLKGAQSEIQRLCEVHARGHKECMSLQWNAAAEVDKQICGPTQPQRPSCTDPLTDLDSVLLRCFFDECFGGGTDIPCVIHGHVQPMPSEGAVPAIEPAVGRQGLLQLCKKMAQTKRALTVLLRYPAVSNSWPA
jgi:hypothetical protein